MLGDLVDVFRRGLNEDLPGRVAPMYLKWKPHVQAPKAKSRPYPPERRQLLSQQMKNLRAGRVGVQHLEAVLRPHPNLEQAAEIFAGAKCFATLDLLQEF